MIQTLIRTKRRNTCNMHEHLTRQHAVSLHRCDVFDMLLNDDGDCQRGANENPMRTDKESNQ